MLIPVAKDEPATSDVHSESTNWKASTTKDWREQRRKLQRRKTLMLVALKKKRDEQERPRVEKGDYMGHAFRGNQWTGGVGVFMAPDAGGGQGGAPVTAASKPLKLASKPKAGAGKIEYPKNPKVAAHPSSLKPEMPKSEREKEGATLKPAQIDAYDSAPKALNHNQAMAYAKLTPAQRKKFDSAPKHYTTDQRFAVAEGRIRGMDYDSVVARAAKPNDPAFQKRGRAGGFTVVTRERLMEVHENHPDLYVDPTRSRFIITTNPKTGTGKGMLLIGVDTGGKDQHYQASKTKASQAVVKHGRVGDMARDIKKLDMSVAKDAMRDPVAAAVLLMRRTGLRADTSQKRGVYGATSLEARHVKVSSSGKITLDFVGKKKVRITVEVTDPDLKKVLLQSMRGKKGTDKLFPGVTANETQAYIQSKMGPGYKNHDLRTLKATSMATALVKQMGMPKTPADLKRLVTEVADKVSAQLGNSRGEALKSYIDPAVFAKWHASIKKRAKRNV